MSACPPRWAERPLSIVLAPAERAAVLGDLHEEFVARATSSPKSAARWYRRQVRGSVVPTLGRRFAPAPTVVSTTVVSNGHWDARFI